MRTDHRVHCDRQHFFGRRKHGRHYDDRCWRKGTSMKFTCNSKDIAGAVAAASKVVNAHTTMPILGNVWLRPRRPAASASAPPISSSRSKTAFRPSVQRGRAVHGASAAVRRVISRTCRRRARDARHADACDAQMRALELRVFHACRPTSIRRCRKASSAISSASTRKRFVKRRPRSRSRRAAKRRAAPCSWARCSRSRVRRLTLVATDGYRLARFELAARRTVDDIRQAHRAGPRARRSRARRERRRHRSHRARRTSQSTRASTRATSKSSRARRWPVPELSSRSSRKSSTGRVVASTPRLLASLRRAEVVAGDRASMVKIAIEGTSLVITASSDTAGNAYEELDVERTGDPMTIAFNAKYLVEILNHVERRDGDARVRRRASADRDQTADRRAAEQAALHPDAACASERRARPRTRTRPNFRNYAALRFEPPERRVHLRRPQRAGQIESARSALAVVHRQIVSHLARSRSRSASGAPAASVAARVRTRHGEVAGRLHDLAGR